MLALVGFAAAAAEPDLQPPPQRLSGAEVRAMLAAIEGLPGQFLVGAYAKCRRLVENNTVTVYGDAEQFGVLFSSNGNCGVVTHGGLLALVRRRDFQVVGWKRGVALAEAIEQFEKKSAQPR